MSTRFGIFASWNGRGDERMRTAQGTLWPQRLPAATDDFVIVPAYREQHGKGQDKKSPKGKGPKHDRASARRSSEGEAPALRAALRACPLDSVNSR
jgi:hypothetical protein